MPETLVDTGLADRIADVRHRIAEAARRAGRAPEEITLVAVSKTWGPEYVVAAYQAGLRIFGENRVEEAAPKAAAVAEMLGQHPKAAGSSLEPPVWHMIGHVQSRKAKEVLPWAAMVHSVESAHLARRLGEFAADSGRQVDVLLEVNVSGEASKYGLAPQDVPEVVDAVAGQPALRLQGLMTMAPIVEQAEQARPVFRALRELNAALAARYPGLPWRHLSMGMSDDYGVAVEEGATIVRVGRAIFGER
jgi:PLP dependent protein